MQINIHLILPQAHFNIYISLSDILGNKKNN